MLNDLLLIRPLHCFIFEHNKNLMHKIKQNIWLLVLCLGFQNTALYAQSTGRMETDRPDQTECP